MAITFSMIGCGKGGSKVIEGRYYCPAKDADSYVLDFHRDGTVDTYYSGQGTYSIDSKGVFKIDISVIHGTGTLNEDGSIDFNTTDSLSYHDLMCAVSVLLKESGIFSVIIPEESVSRLESEANVNGMFKSRIFHIHTTPRKAPKRCLIEFSKNIGKQCVIENVVLEDAPGSRSNWYHQLTKDFYIR